MKLYTKAVCPKCMLVKMWINNSNTKVEIINLDDNEDKANEFREKGILSAPILEVNGEFYTDPSDMEELINA